MQKSFEDQNLELNTPFVYSDGLHASVSFYPHDIKTNATLKFKIDNGEVVPTTINYSTEQLNDGKKITIEIASNGFIIKADGKTHIAESEYDMKSKIEELSIEKHDYEFKYDPEVQNFTNLDATIELIHVDLDEKAAA